MNVSQEAKACVKILLHELQCGLEKLRSYALLMGKQLVEIYNSLEKPRI